MPGPHRPQDTVETADAPAAARPGPDAGAPSPGAPSPLAAAAEATDAIDRLQALKARLDAGALTRAEFEARRNALLDPPR